MGDLGDIGGLVSADAATAISTHSPHPARYLTHTHTATDYQGFSDFRVLCLFLQPFEVQKVVLCVLFHFHRKLPLM